MTIIKKFNEELRRDKLRHHGPGDSKPGVKRFKGTRDYKDVRHQSVKGERQKGKRDLKNLERFDEHNNAEVDISGIKCDHCEYRDDNVQFSDYPQWVNKPCPECGENLLTQSDYDECLKIVNAVDTINSISPEDLDKWVQSLDPDQIDGALDMMNQMKLKRTSGEEDGPGTFDMLGTIRKQNENRHREDAEWGAGWTNDFNELGDDEDEEIFKKQKETYLQGLDDCISQLQSIRSNVEKDGLDDYSTQMIDRIYSELNNGDKLY